MINYYKTVDGRVNEIDEVENGCWINIVAPTEDEIEETAEFLGVDPEFLAAPLDDEETSRIEEEDGVKLVIVDIPLAEKENDSMIYCTVPLGFFITDNYLLTVCLKDNTIIKQFTTGMVKDVSTNMKTRFVLQVLYKVATRYLQYLKQVDKLSSNIEKELHKSMKNKELIQLLDLIKSLVYFSTSLKADEITITKISRGRFLKMYEDDQELLEDVLIEIQQAIEMSNIYSSILSGTMDAFASIISNNLNIVMKFLASITIVMAVPTIITSFYGMNVEGLPYTQWWWFPLLLSIVTSLLVAWILQKKKMF